VHNSTSDSYKVDVLAHSADGLSADYDIINMENYNPLK
jgi:hypothetical protein